MDHPSKWRSDDRLMEYVCEESNRDVTHAKGGVHAKWDRIGHSL